MIRLFLVGIFSIFVSCSFGQLVNKIITVKEVSRIEGTLSSDDMQGRKSGTPGIEKAAAFISNEFKNIGLKSFEKCNGYRQEFVMVKPKQLNLTAKLNNQPFEDKNVVVFTAATQLKVNDGSGYIKTTINAGSNLIKEAQALINAQQNTLVLVDTSYTKTFPILNRMKRSFFKTPFSVVFVLTQSNPADYEIIVNQEIDEQQFTNIVGVLPGKSKKAEMVVFSGHYDHLGIGKPVNGDSIYNGANDDAAGITAVIMLAKYYKALGNNERTLIFTAFTAEEIGGFGSQHFSRQLNPDFVSAMFNIEMIGTESKWGKASAYITGFDKTDMGAILDKNLSGTPFKFYPDPYPDQQLFYRSDNATLARLGVPAHTISTSKMDSEENYHKVSDEIGTLDMKNMTEIIKAIATSAKSIIDGKDTPTRVNINTLR